MAYITKKINGKEYVYLSVREGNRVIQKYVGKKLEKKIAIPPFPSYLFWDTHISKIHYSNNACYIVERILELGDPPAFQWLLKQYSTQKIIELMTLSRNLSLWSKNFWELWFENI